MGLKLLAGMLRNFWPDLYPVADEDGVSTTLAPLTGLNGEDSPGTLLAPIYRVPLSDAPVTYADYLAAGATSKILDDKTREKRIADGALTFDKLKAQVAGEPAAAVRALHDDIEAAIEALADYSAALTEKVGPYAPATGAIREALDTMLAAVRDLGRDQLAATRPKAEAPPEPEPEVAPPETNSPTPQSAPVVEVRGERLPVVANREDALAAVVQLAAYFRRTEPHSLVPYALEQAVRWARMPLIELYRELLPDEQLRGAFFKQVGVPDAE